MQQNIDWRHIVGAVVVVAALVFGGWKLLASGPEKPTAVATPGANASMQDAPEHPPAGVPGPGGAPQGRPAGFPTAQ